MVIFNKPRWGFSMQRLLNHFSTQRVDVLDTVSYRHTARAVLKWRSRPLALALTGKPAKWRPELDRENGNANNGSRNRVVSRLSARFPVLKWRSRPLAKPLYSARRCSMVLVDTWSNSAICGTVNLRPISDCSWSCVMSYDVRPHILVSTLRVLVDVRLEFFRMFLNAEMFRYTSYGNLIRESKQLTAFKIWYMFPSAPSISNVSTGFVKLQQTFSIFNLTAIDSIVAAFARSSAMLTEEWEERGKWLVSRFCSVNRAGLVSELLHHIFSVKSTIYQNWLEPAFTKVKKLLKKILSTN